MGLFNRFSGGLLWLAVIALCSEAALGRILETLNCTQSSVAFNGQCGRALDGNTARNYGRNSCTHTKQQPRPWWQATLKNVSRVKAIRIFNRGDCCAERLNSFTVQVDGRVCAVHKSAKPFDVKKLACNMNGRVVRIVNTGGTILTLCEVQIIGWPVRPPGSCRKAKAQLLIKKLQLAKKQLKRGIRNARTAFTKAAKAIRQQQKKQMPLRRTCEHSVGTFACPKGYTVSIQQAMYGRQSTKFCPRGRLSARTNCAAKKALAIAKSRCRGRQSCQVPARNSIFGDPCPGTFKYLQISYRCVQRPGQVRNRLKAVRRRYRSSKRQLMAQFRAKKIGLKAKIVTEKRRYKRCIGGMSCQGGQSRALKQALAQEQQRHKTALANAQRAKTSELAGVAGKRIVTKPETRTCENHVQSITCPAGYVIKLLSVFYGRKDAASCPHPQIRTIKCQARNAVVKVRAACDGKQSCKLQSSNSVFGDPCPGTYKYMLVRHSCQMTDAKLKAVRAAVDARYRSTVARLGKQHLAKTGPKLHPAAAAEHRKPATTAGLDYGSSETKAPKSKAKRSPVRQGEEIAERNREAQCSVANQTSQ
uniref:SUEL-type lectin domain-containing protein n=1 Tax=Macrostomum lignano TaxID=282301 RepID=A0A1I8HJQ1_9PLAT